MHRDSGLALIELMVVIAIIGILAAIATPNYLTYRNSSKMRSAAGIIKGDLHRAKITAVKSNALITVQFASGSYTITSLGTRDMTAGVTYTADPVSPLAGDNTTFSAKGVPNHSINDTGRIVLSAPDSTEMKRITIGRLGQITIETRI